MFKHKETSEEKDFIDICLEWKKKLSPVLKNLNDQSSDGELAAFASYAMAFADSFVALVDTYDTVR